MDSRRRAARRKPRRAVARRPRNLGEQEEEEEEEKEPAASTSVKCFAVGMIIVLVVNLSFMTIIMFPRTAPAQPADATEGGLYSSDPQAAAAADPARQRLRAELAAAPLGQSGALAGEPSPPGWVTAPALRGGPAVGVAGARGTPQVAAGTVAARGGIAAFDGMSWLQLPKAVDSDELTFSTWLYLPDILAADFPASSESMKTVASTKISGCKVEGDLTKGWALFVHEWGTTNRQLRLSWTDSSSACHELFSKTSLVPYNTWVNIGFSLSKQRDRAMIFLGTSVVADTKAMLGTYHRQSQVLAVASAPVAARSVLHHNAGQLVLGAHRPHDADGGESAHALMGFLGDVRVLHQAWGDPAEALRVIGCPAKDLPAQLQPQAMAVDVQFMPGAKLENNVGGTEILGRRVNEVGSSIGFVMLQNWNEAPLLAKDAPVVDATTAKPGTTLPYAELQSTWPAEWTARFSQERLADSQREASPWADAVREAMRYTWNGYREKAWGKDDIKPVSGQGKDWCRMAITMVDGLSTLWLMGLDKEFDEATNFLQGITFPAPGTHGKHSLFEINIRAVGGLLSAYSLSNQGVFLETARRLVDNMMLAFETPSGIPMAEVDVGTGAAGWHSWSSKVVLAEVATVQVEFRYLSHVTGDDKYARVADRAMMAVLDAANGRGLVPIYMTKDKTPAFAGSKISLGAMGDSYYEYLLKQWIQNGKKDNHLKNTWRTAMKEMQQQLVMKTAGGITFIAEKEGGRQRPRMDHLACFVAGMLMLGSRTLPKAEVSADWEPLAAELTETCYQMYKRSPSGLSPEYWQFAVGERTKDMIIPNDAPQYLLRPEAAEAIYYMWYYTGDHKYRRMAWEMFSAVDRHCKARWGYSAVIDVRKSKPKQKDSQESFWLAETLKYFYLIFSPRSTLNLEQFVLNTEAQPLRIWTE